MSEEPLSKEALLANLGFTNEVRRLEDTNSVIARIARGELDDAIEHATRQLEKEDANPVLTRLEERYDEPVDQEKTDDPVNHPSHYNQYDGIEVIQLTEQMNFNRGNAVKYICRAGFKAPEKELEDLHKARWYLDREIHRITEARKQ